MSIVNERIKYRRTQLGYTLLYIADLLGVKEATVQRYESGDIKNIKHETIVELSKILKCDPAYLMGWQEEPTSYVSITIDESRLVNSYRTLNQTGRNKLIERADELHDLGYTIENDKKEA